MESNSQHFADELANLIGRIRQKGVKLWSKDKCLHYKAPKGALTPDEIERFREFRVQIVALLQRATGAETAEQKMAHPLCRDRAPMAFQQLAHWHLYKLSERPAIRQIASATRLRGRLNVEALRASIAEVVRRHDALRTRIIVEDGTPMQRIMQSGDCELELTDLTKVSEDLRDAQVSHLIERHILGPVDVAMGPMFVVQLLRLYEDEHVLIVAMEHMISDAVSLNLLLHETFTAYVQLLNGCAVSLPEVPIQFSDYALRQRNLLQSWLKEHSEYWQERVAKCQRSRFPDSPRAPTEALSGWGIVPIRIAIDLKRELRDWCRLRRTTLVMGVFTAYVALVLRWCKASESVIQYQSDGRVTPELQNAIGYFASVLYLRIETFESDTFFDLMNRITHEYCNAYEHADFAYFAAQRPRAEFARSSAFNWVPQGNKFDIPKLADTITCSPLRFVHPMARTLDVDSEPSIVLYDTDDGETTGEVWFPLNRFSVDTMERFGRNFQVFIRALLSRPQERVEDVVLL